MGAIVDEDEDWDDYDRFDEDEPEDEWVYDCGDANCIMNYQPHFRSECHTPEMVQAMEEEAAESQVRR